ncbi:MAG: septum formation initiator family protein [Candidatus Fermentithermobacillus carboniphilus]|uniref:Septum formation initiator family protein n=1 Tax=Candidatus Fermentithermobacillus carboniphilus TaxID=3085328 RepID=A0AAT9L9Q4_9FIRM|nr:MAG: septum formation initiator family protein [Candidatus Fermentithermobacillus carboniphilus]
MRNRPSRKRWPRMKLGLIWFVGLALFISLAVRQTEVLSAKKRLKALQEEIRYYSAQNSALEKQIEILKSDEHIEKVAREKLGLVRPGEVQYVVQKGDTGK